MPNFRRMRHGDPLSPFLFNRAANCLQRMIQLAQSSGQIVGLIPHLIDKRVVILQYVDDTILFVQADLDSVRNFKLLLYCFFEHMSGLKINF